MKLGGRGTIEAITGTCASEFLTRLHSRRWLDLQAHLKGLKLFQMVVNKIQLFIVLTKGC